MIKFVYNLELNRVSKIYIYRLFIYLTDNKLVLYRKNDPKLKYNYILKEIVFFNKNSYDANNTLNYLYYYEKVIFVKRTPTLFPKQI